MKRILTIVIVVTALMLHSCGGVKKVTPPPVKTIAPVKTDPAPVKDEYVLFTKKIYDQLVANKIDLKKVQYYNDQDIYLAKGKEISGIKVVNGKIVEEAGNNVDKIIIDKFTPGRCELVESDGLRIIFKDGSTAFKFINSKTYLPENFIFSGANWDNNGTCEVEYNGARYRASCGGGCSSVADVKLVVKKSFLDKNNINEQKLPGSIVN
ncbi:MAG: hypothetical protein QM541_09695 [Flavobacterium sp.]|nr:hypothetical protein [Flavobacterium sp.]